MEIGYNIHISNLNFHQNKILKTEKKKEVANNKLVLAYIILKRAYRGISASALMEA